MIEIIAEIGVNHNGKESVAETLIRQAHVAGVDTVKFQMFQGDRYPELQFAASTWFNLKRLVEDLGMMFLCTPDDWDDVLFLVEGLQVKRLKIGSSNVTNIPLLMKIAALDLPIILSSGACTHEELDRAFKTITVGVIMHCVSSYPAPVDQLNLACIKSECCLGYSDHTLGYDYQSALVALGMGACVFEKHFTLDHGHKGPDHAMSANLPELRTYVRQLRRYASAIGDGDKRIMSCEKKNRVEYDAFVRAQYTLETN